MDDAPARNLPAERKPQFTSGATVAALVPQTLEEAYRLSQALAASGMVPRGIDKPEQILVAIMAGAELGLAPFQSLQSFAVVNGRPTLWGDGLMAVVRSRGVQVKEWLEGEDDAMVAHCVVTRPDTGEEIARTFTVADAKKAGLWGKAGPWTQYPKRMLQMRARVAIRDGCADMLRGIQIREEVEDYTHVRDITPKPSGLRERLAGPSGEGFTSVQAEADQPVDFAEQAAEVAEAEFVEPPADDGLPIRDDTPPAAEADDFPGDRTGEPVAQLDLADASFDALDWAASFTRGLAGLTTVSEVSEAWSKAKASGNVVKLRGRSEEAAKQLADAVNDRVAEIKKAAG